LSWAQLRREEKRIVAPQALDIRALNRTVISRRDLLIGSLLAPSLLTLPADANALNRGLQQQVAGLERSHGGRLGAAVLDTASTKLISHCGDERFALCSTFKFLAAAFVLKRVDSNEESLTRRIVYARDYLVPHSPITEKHVGQRGLTVGEACEAAVTLSDNTAGNLFAGQLWRAGGTDGLHTLARGQRHASRPPRIRDSRIANSEYTAGTTL
jgi:beta-lactamase class A